MQMSKLTQFTIVDGEKSQDNFYSTDVSIDFGENVEDKKKPLKIIFLDIDGVICNPRYSWAHGDVGGVFKLLDQTAMLLVKKPCTDTGAKIVISSSWRIGYDYFKMYQLLSAACPKFGRLIYYNEKFPNFWATGSRGDRQAEIKEWLELAKNNLDEIVEAFVILDDDNLVSNKSNYDPFILDRLVFTDGYDGFGLHDYFDAEALLNNRSRPERHND